MNPRLLPLLALVALAASCEDPHHVGLYSTEDKAPSLEAAKIEALEHMGPTLIDQGINFAVYSENATRIELLLFDDPNSERATRQFEMKRFGDVWNLYVQGVGLGQNYGFVAWGPNWEHHPDWYPGSIHGFVADVDAQGNRFNPNKLLTDPYCKAHHRDFDWSKASLATGPKRTDVTYAAASKCVVVKSEYKWTENERSWRDKRADAKWRGHSWKDLILYEVHPTGFTKSPASGVVHPGTYKGLAEKADYFAELGITAIELLPVMEKPLDGGYWGYQTLNFFMPEITYAMRNEQASVIDEFKAMVDVFHQKGIEVILDVVYNHTGEGGLWRSKLEFDVTPWSEYDSQLINYDPAEVAGLYSFRGLDNQAYYALDPTGKTYWNNTGVGNETRANHRPFRRMTMDSLRYWAAELHVDGFRFDLAPILGQKDLDYNTWDDPKNTVLQEIIDDPVLQATNTRIIAEGWSAGGKYCHWGGGNYDTVRIGHFPNSSNQPGNGWYEWNGKFRDWWREFVNRDYWKLNNDAGRICLTEEEAKTRPNPPPDMGFFTYGSDAWYKPTGRRPYHSVNFITVHDGFTLYDLLSYDQKQNKCGPLNPVCCEQPNSPFCDRNSGDDNSRQYDWSKACRRNLSDGKPNPDFRPQYCECTEATADPASCELTAEPFKRQQMRNLFTAMFISHGTPMLYGGDEWMRTQLGNNNAYSTRADNEYNWFDWGKWLPEAERHRMFDFVKQLIQFRKDHAYALAPDDYGQAAPFEWRSPGNGEPNWSGRSMMIHYHDASRGPELAILINMELDAVDFTLPSGRQWKRVIDTQKYFDTDKYVATTGGDPNLTRNATLDVPLAVPGATYGAPSRSIVILESKK